MHTTHIEYLSDKSIVCEEPARLGSDFIVTQVALTSTQVPCTLCTALVFKHNSDEALKERFASNALDVTYSAGTYDQPQLDPMRNLAMGIIMASFFWVVVGILLSLWVV